MIPYVNPVNTFVHAEKYKPGQIITNWQNVEEFEKESAAYLESKYAVAFNSCTIALFCIFSALKLAGKKILMPSFTWRSTADAAMMSGAEPVFVDIDKKTLCLSLDHIEKIFHAQPDLIGQVGAVCAVDVFGCPVDYETLETLGLPIIVDSAHSYGAQYKGEGIGKHAIHAFSFSPTKVLVSNEGGLVCCNDAELAKELRVAKNWAGRMTEYNAACALEGLKNLPYVFAEKQKFAIQYKKVAQRFGWQVQQIPQGSKSTFKDFIFVFNSTEERNAIQKHLEDADIATKIYFVPVHQLPKFQNCLHGDLDNTMKIFRRSLCLPSWPGINLDYVLEELEGGANAYLGRNRKRISVSRPCSIGVCSG